MLNKQSVAGILLAAGCPVLLWASTLAARVECRIDMQAKTVVPLQHRPESYPFMLLLAAAQGYAAWQLLKGDRVQASLALAGEEEPVGAISPSIAPEFKPEQTAVSEVPLPMPIQLGARLEQVAVVSPFDAPKETQFYDVAKDLGGDHANKIFPQNSLIVGTPGAGKGIVVSNAVRAIKAQFPELIVVGIDPKADPDEDGLWETGTHSYTHVFRKAVIDLSPDEIAEWVAVAIHSFKQLPKSSPALLVFDELLAINSSFKELDKNSKFKSVPPWMSTYLTHLISLGDSSGKWFWGVTQAADDKSLPFDTSVRNNLRSVAIVSMHNLGAVQGLLRTDVIPSGQKSIESIQENVDASPVSRAFYDRKTNRWYPMLRLKNYGKDRNPFAQSDLISGSTVREPGSNSEPQRTAESSQNEPLNRLAVNETSDLYQPGSEVREPVQKLLKPLDPGLKTDEDITNRLRDFQSAGLNQAQAILAIWGFRKGGSANYQCAVFEYKRLLGE